MTQPDPLFWSSACQLRGIYRTTIFWSFMLSGVYMKDPVTEISLPWAWIQPNVLCEQLALLQSLLHQDWLIRGLSGERRTVYAVKQCEICSLTKCCGRNSCLSSPSTMGFGKDPQQRWVMESSRSSGRNSPQSSSAHSCSSSWISHIKDSILICCVSDFFSFSCLQVSRLTVRCSTALSSATPAASWPLTLMGLWPVWSAWRPCSVSASVCQSRGIPDNFGFVKFLIFLTVNVTDCMEMGECQNKCICLTNQKRNSKSFTDWMIMECEATCFHNLPWSSALQSSPLYVQCSGHQVVPSPTNGTIYHL